MSFWDTVFAVMVGSFLYGLISDVAKVCAVATVAWIKVRARARAQPADLRERHRGSES